MQAICFYLGKVLLSLMTKISKEATKSETQHRKNLRWVSLRFTQPTTYKKPNT